MKDNGILIVVAHPDDEVLWMWWTICKLVSLWKKVSILLLSSITWNARWNNESEKRLWNFKEVIKNFWIENVFYEDFPDTSFDTIKFLDIVKSIEKIVDLVKPSIIYTHFFNDINIDHNLTSRAVLTLLRPIEKYKYVKKIYLFEVLSSTSWGIWNNFLPNYYEDISDYIEIKKQIFSIYKSEIQKFPHPRNSEWIETLAKYRWMESWLNFAEAFILYREVN
jgi:LmbE family N-acetylglucosaminyl deacetylase